MRKGNWKITSLLILVLLLSYVFTYIYYRQTHTEIWEKDKNAYVIFPESKILYYIYRPMMIADAGITGMRFHIGEHRE